MLTLIDSSSTNLLTAGTVVRVVFSTVPPDNKGLQNVIRKRFKMHMPSFRIRACGRLTGERYYVDFTAPKDTEMQSIRYEVDTLAMAYAVSIKNAQTTPAS
ncbi:hypothetical protein [Hymenobacter sp. GOD-10R]|uniref:hypothetical protein n=1 Tax=Hymenobacter sp. GOD-10R TaxID=3093922 RepID=UPI002D77023B|nr:hypothetical protein [Hymenobacter sp. GOD-10R]WRQ28996.1 hypothetical protein SD425_01800 [Hymenobacter sp. GOD-10R]